MNQRPIVALLVLLSTFSAISEADDTAEVASQQTGNSDHDIGFIGTLIGGASFAGKTDHTIKTTAGASVGTAESKDKAAPLFGFEGQYQPIQYFATAFQFNWTKYNYKSGGPSDTELSFLLIPKFRRTFSSWAPWAGFGVGLVSTSFGETSRTVDNITITLDDKSALNLAISPRIGCDFDISDDVLIGIEAGYTTLSATVGVTAVSGTTVVKFNDEVGRSWFHSAARVGFRF